MEEKTKFCSQCGRENKADALFCRACGHRFAPAAAKTQPAGAPEAKKPRRKRCPYCNALIPPDSVSCEYCGGAIKPPVAKPGAEKTDTAPAASAAPVSVSDAGTGTKKSRTEERLSGTAEAADGIKRTKDGAAGNRKSGSAAVNTGSEKKPEKKHGCLRFFAFLLVIAILFVSFVEPGYVRKWLGDDVKRKPKSIADISESEVEALTDPSPAGLSGVEFAPEAYRSEPVRADVSLDNTSVRFDNGVSLEFGDYCLDEEPEELTVRSLGETNDGTYAAIGYDFLLDGSGADFDGLVKITVPYEKSWGENVFVQYLDEKTGEWEIIYAAPDGNGNMTFYTDHFCTYAVFCDMVNHGKSGSANGDIITFTDKYGDGMYIEALMHWDNLAARIREGKLADEAKIRERSKNGGVDFVESALGFSCNSSDGVSAAAEIAGCQTLADVLGPLGISLDVAQVMYRGYKQGFMNAISDMDYWEYVATKAVEAGSKLPGKVGLACKVLRIMYSVYKVSGNAVDAVLLDGASDRVDYAYRLFSSKYLVYNSRKGYVDYAYTATALDEAKLVLDPGVSRLKCLRADSDWTEVFNDAYAREKKGQMDAFEYVERIIDSYAKVFWRVKKADLEDFLRNNYAGGYIWDGKLINSYKTPSTRERDAYIAKYKSDLYRWLGGFMETLMKKKYNDVLSEVYSKYVKLIAEMNTEYTITLKDPDKTYFTESEFSGHTIGLASSGTGDITLNISQHEMNGQVRITGATYMLAGCPKTLRVLGTKENASDTSQNYLTKKVNLVSPETVIILDRKEEKPAEEYDFYSALEDGIDWGQSDAGHTGETKPKDETKPETGPKSDIPEVREEDIIDYRFLGYWKCDDGLGSYTLNVLELNSKGSLVWWMFTKHDAKTHSATVSIYPEFDWDAKKGVLHLAPTRQRAGTRGEFRTEEVTMTMNTDGFIAGESYQGFVMERIPEREVYDYDVDRYPGMSTPDEDSVSYDMSGGSVPFQGTQPVGGGISIAGQVNLGGDGN